MSRNGACQPLGYYPETLPLRGHTGGSELWSPGEFGPPLGGIWDSLQQLETMRYLTWVLAPSLLGGVQQDRACGRQGTVGANGWFSKETPREKLGPPGPELWGSR